MTIYTLTPAHNEERAIGRVITEIPDMVEQIFIVNNQSTDSTAAVALASDDRVVVIDEPRRGYGMACLTGLAEIRKNPPEIVVFIDGDYSDYPSEIDRVVEPILSNQADLVIGSRTKGIHEKGALLPQARFGNALASLLIRIFYSHTYTDLGPFRAIRWTSLEKLQMRDTSFGWTVEMQVKAVKAGLRITEVPVSYKKRIGKSKVTGTIKGTIMAGVFIIGTIFRYLFWKPAID